MSRSIFHLAFPVKDIDSTIEFYRDQLGFGIDLITKQRCIINFDGHQLVAHVSNEDLDSKASIYPRHFGVIFDDARQFETLLKSVRDQNIELFQEHFERFPGTPREHRTFFLKDPSNNAIEFKWYRNPDLILKDDQGGDEYLIDYSKSK